MLFVDLHVQDLLVGTYLCRICWLHRDLLVQGLQSGTVIFVDLHVQDLLGT